MRRRTSIFAGWLAGGGVLLGAFPAVAGQPAGTDIGPPDVLQHVERVHDELELVRFVMGVPRNEQPELGVSGAAPREVYFQALTMFRKADRLCFEHTRERGEEPEVPSGDIRPADVYTVVEASLERFRRVKDELGITTETQRSERDPDATPTDVLRSIVHANRQLNLLLERRFAPSDVFEQVTLGVGYAARLLERFPEAVTMPAEPAFESGKRPGDVYRRLLECFRRIRRIADALGLQMLELETDESAINEAEPSDVYDIASLLVSELAYLHTQLPGTQPPREVYFPGRKFPSHVFQRAGILEQQLIELEERVERNPGWLVAGSGR